MCFPTYIQVSPTAASSLTNSPSSCRKNTCSMPSKPYATECGKRTSESRRLLRTTNVTNGTCSNSISNRRATAHGQMLRKRYFQAIGIFQEPTQHNAKSRVVPVPLSVPSPMTPPKTWSRKSSVAEVTKPFKFQPLSRRTSSMSTASTCTTSTTSTASTTYTDNSKKKVSFSQDSPTIVHIIPARHAYSRDTRQKLWISCEEMKQSYSRNVTEFRAERWDWRLCVEEHEFVAIQGQLVHPVHIYLAAAAHQEQLYHLNRQRSQYGASSQANLKNHFHRVMSAQQQSA